MKSLLLAAVSTKVYELAHARAGDKGNTSNVSVVAYSLSCIMLDIDL